MTVVYTHEVATGSQGFGNFWRMLFKWTGSIYQLVYHDFIVYFSLYYCINIPYRIFLSHRDDEDTAKQYFVEFVNYARAASGLIPLQFILGFYVSQVISRWWDMFMSIPWPDDLAVLVASSVRGHDERGRLMRRTILRYTNLSLVMVFTMMSPQCRYRFPTLDQLVEAGFLVPHERLILEHLNEKTLGPKYYVPIVWAASVAARAKKEGRIKDDIQLYHVIKEINGFRSKLGDVLSYDWVNIPLVYTQVATLATYAYFLSCLMGKQMLNETFDLYVPVFLVLEFIFMLGWLKVAETMINPFGEDDDDFEVNWLIDRNITVSYMIVDEMNNEFPEMVKDGFWETKIPDELMYTPEALKFKTAGPGEGSAAYVEEDRKSTKGDGTPTSKRSLINFTGRRSADSSQKKDEEASGDGVKKIVSEKFLDQFMEHKIVPEYKESVFEFHNKENPPQNKIRRTSNTSGVP